MPALNMMLDWHRSKETTAEECRIACLRERDMTQKQAAASGFTM